MADLTKINGGDSTFISLGVPLTNAKAALADKPPAPLDLLTGDRYEPKTSAQAAPPTYDEMAQRWGSMKTTHAADNPFETADGQSRPTAAETAAEAATKHRQTGDLHLLGSYNATAAEHARGAELAAKQGDITSARRYEEYANNERGLLAQHRPERARMLGVEQPRYGSYNAFVQANAERDHLAFLHDTADGKFKKAATFVPEARKNASFSARAMDSMRQFGKALVAAYKNFKGFGGFSLR